MAQSNPTRMRRVLSVGSVGHSQQRLVLGQDTFLSGHPRPVEVMQNPPTLVLGGYPAILQPLTSASFGPQSRHSDLLAPSGGSRLATPARHRCNCPSESLTPPSLAELEIRRPHRSCSSGALVNGGDVSSAQQLPTKQWRSGEGPSEQVFPTSQLGGAAVSAASTPLKTTSSTSMNYAYNSPRGCSAQLTLTVSTPLPLSSFRKSSLQSPAQISSVAAGVVRAPISSASPKAKSSSSAVAGHPESQALSSISVYNPRTEQPSPSSAQNHSEITSPRSWQHRSADRTSLQSLTSRGDFLREAGALSRSDLGPNGSEAWEDSLSSKRRCGTVTSPRWNKIVEMAPAIAGDDVEALAEVPSPRNSMRQTLALEPGVNLAATTCSILGALDSLGAEGGSEDFTPPLGFVCSDGGVRPLRTSPSRRQIVERLRVQQVTSSSASGNGSDGWSPLVPKSMRLHCQPAVVSPSGCFPPFDQSASSSGGTFGGLAAPVGLGRTLLERTKISIMKRAERARLGEVRRLLKEEEEMRECTFVPNLSPRRDTSSRGRRRALSTPRSLHNNTLRSEVSRHPADLSWVRTQSLGENPNAEADWKYCNEIPATWLQTRLRQRLDPWRCSSRPLEAEDLERHAATQQPRQQPMSPRDCPQGVVSIVCASPQPEPQPEFPQMKEIRVVPMSPRDCRAESNEPNDPSRIDAQREMSAQCLRPDRLSERQREHCEQILEKQCALVHLFEDLHAGAMELSELNDLRTPREHNGEQEPQPSTANEFFLRKLDVVHALERLEAEVSCLSPLELKHLVEAGFGFGFSEAMRRATQDGGGAHPSPNSNLEMIRRAQEDRWKGTGVGGARREGERKRVEALCEGVGGINLVSSHAQSPKASAHSTEESLAHSSKVVLGHLPGSPGTEETHQGLWERADACRDVCD